LLPKTFMGGVLNPLSLPTLQQISPHSLPKLLLQQLTST